MVMRLFWLLGVALLLGQPAVQAASLTVGGGAAAIQRADLPREAQDTLRLIERGGPFPFDRDGVVFSNFEKQLPKQPRGYYHEYTVRTPGSRNRGARRIVCGSLPECFYTADHYKTFARIKE